MSSTLHCPHCSSPLPGASERAATRCEACRLVVGPGRALTAQQAADQVDTVGGRSGTIRNAATRSGAVAGDEGLIVAALERVAGRIGVRVERLRLADYDTARHEDPELPSVGEVLATFGGWKLAREATRAPDRRPVTDAPEA